MLMSMPSLLRRDAGGRDSSTVHGCAPAQGSAVPWDDGWVFTGPHIFEPSRQMAAEARNRTWSGNGKAMDLAGKNSAQGTAAGRFHDL